MVSDSMGIIVSFYLDLVAKTKFYKLPKFANLAYI